MKKALLVSCILLALAASTAQARLNFGIKALSLKETALFGTSRAPVPTSQMLGCYFGLDAGSKVVVVGGLDFSNFRYKNEETDGVLASRREIRVTAFTPHFGVKFYFSPRTSGKIIPYLEGGIFKTFASAKFEDSNETVAYNDLQTELIKKLNSPIGFYPAFGVEYFFSDNFSLGGEMGIRFSFASADVTEAGTTNNTKIDNDFWSHYIGITLNYHFGGRY